MLYYRTCLYLFRSDLPCRSRGTTQQQQQHSISQLETAHAVLVGGWATPLKDMTSSIGMMTAIPNINGKMPKMATKPPTSVNMQPQHGTRGPDEIGKVDPKNTKARRKDQSRKSLEGIQSRDTQGR